MSTPSSSGSHLRSIVDAVSDQFPAGLRVLVVDDDPTCLLMLVKMLKACLYKDFWNWLNKLQIEARYAFISFVIFLIYIFFWFDEIRPISVTRCKRAKAALSLLKKNKNGFDIVITDVHMPDMDGFELLEHIGLEMDLPVIMMSADDKKHVVMKGVIHGACDYLIKPVPIEALKNIWQHVFRKRKNIWQHDADYSSSANEGKCSKKRRGEEEDANKRDDRSTLKKPRVVWSVELQRQFMAAVNQLGIHKYSWTYKRPDIDGLIEIRKLCEAGKLKIPLDKTYPITQVREAHEAKDKKLIPDKIYIYMKRNSYTGINPNTICMNLNMSN